ncbi:hypothetical protein KPH14_012832 [Odynerus spinipes]|uniref:CCHC-type domain-containing protein n=1 Tax=Odynerus spinipes TaxID=1348599 RepID=A0AAD9RD76_9HYME|nr:hypothetical protein KPH14_012832 [Odynerus spinipes]
MAEGTPIPIGKIEPLYNDNYYVWSVRVKSILKARKLYQDVIERDEPPTSREVDSPAYKLREKWESKNDEAFGIIINMLSDAQAGQFLTEENAGKLWKKLKDIHEGNVEDKKIDIGLELKNIKMQNSETVNEYIGRIRSIQARSATLGQVIPEREITYHAVRGIHYKFDRIAAALRAQRGIMLEEIQQALKEEEGFMRPGTINGQNVQMDTYRNEKAYRATRDVRRGGNNSGCFICGRRNHIARDCYNRSTPNANTNRNWTYRGNHNNFNRGNRRNNNSREQGNLAMQERGTEYTFHTVVDSDYNRDKDIHEKWWKKWTLVFRKLRRL